MKQEDLNRPFLTIEPMSLEEQGKGGHKLTLSYSFRETLFGEMLVASTAKGVCYLAFIIGDYHSDLEELKSVFPRATYEQRTDDYQQKAIAALAMDKENRKQIPLHLKGTDFQLNVWNSLLNIPFGELSSYRKIAIQVRRPEAFRAVGTAIGSNPVSVLIPCHRVVRTDGSLGGYHWGLERKIQLLEWEQKHKE